MEIGKKFMIFGLIISLFLIPAFAQTEVAVPIEAIRKQVEGIAITQPKPIEISIQKSEEVKSIPLDCKNLCGDGICQRVVCLEAGCPCPETREFCPKDCEKVQETIAQPMITLPTEASVKISPKGEHVMVEEKPVEFKGVKGIPLISFEVKPLLPKELISQVAALEKTKVSVKVEVDEKEEVIKLEVEGSVVKTKETLKFENSSLKVETQKKEVFVNVMPNIAERIVKAEEMQKIEEIELKEVEERVVYEVDGVKEAKLLWIIPVTIPIKTEVNVETGKIEKIEKPWWSFLAF